MRECMEVVVFYFGLKIGNMERNEAILTTSFLYFVGLTTFADCSHVWHSFLVLKTAGQVVLASQCKRIALLGGLVRETSFAIDSQLPHFQ